MTADDVRAALSAAGVDLGPPRQLSDESGTLTIHRIVHPILSGHLRVSAWLDMPPSWSLLIRTPSDDAPARLGLVSVNIWSGDIRIPTADAIRALTEVCVQLASPAWADECTEYARSFRRGPIMTRCVEWTWRTT
jgi:hypothetical protein